jgi:hypothetical protein
MYAGLTLLKSGNTNHNYIHDSFLLIQHFFLGCKTWCKMELAGPPPSCRLDFGMCTVELTRDLPTSENGSGDILGTSRHAQEMLELALKPGSASSNSSYFSCNVLHSIKYILSKKNLFFFVHKTSLTLPPSIEVSVPSQKNEQ